MVESLEGLSLYLDSNSVIYAVEGGTPWSAQLRNLLEKGAEDLIAHYKAMFSDESPLQVIGVTRPILITAARIRANARIRLMDAIHLATAAALNCSHLVSNDVRLFGQLPGGMVGVRPADLPAP